jgi:threonine dehydratase
MPDPITRTRIAQTHALIEPHIRMTPIFEVDGRDFGLPPCTLVFKMEQLQYTGSFKARGAFANLLLRDVPPVGVVAASGGNHGVAVAWAARSLDIPATIFLPGVASPEKIRRIRESGAELVIVSDRYADALAASEEHAGRTGALQLHAYDQAETILGQGTLALELERQDPYLDALLVAVGGGGLIAGIAAWHEGRLPVIGVEPEAAPTLTAALAAGEPVDAPAGGIAADSLAPKRVGRLTFPIAKRYVREVLLVTDDAIREAQRALWSQLRLALEPGGAAAFAALLAGKLEPEPGQRIGIVLCGANTDAVDFERTPAA